jgi:ribosome-associated protein
MNTYIQAMILITLNEQEISFQAIRAQGAGGQNVNKVSSALHLRFDIRASSLPEIIKQRLLNLNDQRISKDGIIIIKAQQSRSQEQNRLDAIERLRALLESVAVTAKTRHATKPRYGARMRRLENKTRRSGIKQLRGKIHE